MSLNKSRYHVWKKKTKVGSGIETSFATRKERLQEEHVRLEKQLSVKFQAEYENKYEQQLQGELDSVKQEARRDVQAKIDDIEKQYQLALADKDEEIVRQETRVKQTQWEGEELESRYQQLLDTQRVSQQVTVSRLEEEKQALQLNSSCKVN